MQLAIKHIIVMTFLLIISILFIALGPDSSVVPEGNSNLSKIDFVSGTTSTSKSTVQLERRQLVAVGVILAKGLSAIIMGVFALFCVYSRVGKCLTKRNEAVSSAAERRIADV